MSRTDVFTYLFNEYFEADVTCIGQASGFTSQQINSWLSGKTQPSKRTIEYLIHCTLAPEFKVIAEFAHFQPEQSIRPQLRAALSPHQDKPGIYAFYDSMANLLYVGKATRLLEEIYQALRQGIAVPFPKGVKLTPDKRYQVVKYISAYDVGQSQWVDYPKHVESLLLRISKPPLNQRIGYLERLQVALEA